MKQAKERFGVKQRLVVDVAREASRNVEKAAGDAGKGSKPAA
jgi:hypothetical protein